ncbi:MAG: M56 family metallopeptidase, partial [Gemmatimonadaceae bacterium]
VVHVPALAALRPAAAAIRAPSAARVPRAAAPRVMGSEDIWSGVGEPAHRAPSPAAVTALVWLAGVALLLARIARSHLLAAGVARRARPVADAAALRCLERMRGRRGLRHVVPLRESTELAAPATVGVVRPVVIIPVGAASDLETLRPALEHELAHVARRDGLVELLARLACALHWYDPLVWRAARALGAERERACDDLVLTSGVAPDRYADVLLDAARAVRRGVAPPAGALALARPSELETRLVAILDDARPRSALPRWAAAASVVASVAIATMAGAVRVEATEHRTAARPGTTPLVVAQPVAPAARLPALEPDRRADSVALPRSERVAASDAEVDALLRRAAAVLPDYLVGPDSALAARLGRALERVPTHEGDLVRERAAWALLAGRGGRLMEAIVSALDDRDWRVRAYAAWALSLAGPDARRDPRTEPRLVALLADPVWRMRAAAAYALRDVGSAAALPAMRRALGDAAWQVRASAVEFVAAAGGAAERETLRPLLEDRHIAVRGAARAALDDLTAR